MKDCVFAADRWFLVPRGVAPHSPSRLGKEVTVCFLLSSLVNVVHRVGHQIAAPVEYHDRCQMETWAKTDSTPDMFPEYRCLPHCFLTMVNNHGVLF